MATILVVDDAPVVRMAIRKVLELVAHEVIECGNGCDAADLLAGGVDIDLMITDILMPEADGLELLAKFHRERPNVPVVAMSGGGLIDSKTCLEMAECLGVAATLRKPFEAAELLGTVKRLLDTRTAATEQVAPAPLGENAPN
jgi:two-component system, chemotaxis family, chemotaxis protein CheY